MLNQLEYQVEDHQYTIIYLHGLGEKIQIVQELFKEYQKKQLRSCKIVMPIAPVRFATVINGQTISWYDVKQRSQKSFDLPVHEHFGLTQFKQSKERIKSLIQNQSQLLIQKGGPSRVIMIGFSQGVALAFQTLLSLSVEILGVVGISGFIFPTTPLNQHSSKLRLFYGTKDKVRPWQQVSKVYQGKLKQEQLVRVKGAGHDIKKILPAAISFIQKNWLQI